MALRDRGAPGRELEEQEAYGAEPAKQGTEEEDETELEGDPGSVEHVLQVVQESQQAGEAEESQAKPSQGDVNEEELECVEGGEEDGEEGQEALGEDGEERGEVATPALPGGVQELGGQDTQILLPSWSRRGVEEGGERGCVATVRYP